MIQTIEQTTSIKDKNFSVDKIGQYTLCLNASSSVFSFIVYDSEDSRCLAIDEYQVDGSSSSYLDQVYQIFADHTFLSAGFWKSIKVAVQDSLFTLVPLELFDEESASSYLTVNQEINDEVESISFYKHEDLQMVNVFSYPKKLKELLEKRYPNKEITFYPGISAFIDGAKKTVGLGGAKQAIISNTGHDLSVLITEFDKVVFANKFKWRTTEDFVFYVLYSFKHHFLNQDKNTLTVYGDLSDVSAEYQKIGDFIREIKLGERTKDIKFSYDFDEIEEHMHLELLDIPNL